MAARQSSLLGSSTARSKAACSRESVKPTPGVSLLAQLVNTESGSYNKAGVDRVGQILQERLQSAGIRTTIHPSDTHGNCLSAEVPGSDGPDAPHVLLMGHMDTVFPDGTVAERPYRVEGTIAYGPGVADTNTVGGRMLSHSSNFNGRLSTQDGRRNP